ncbi:MAG: TrkA family potassium uptake protein [Halolamina sp.]
MSVADAVRSRPLLRRTIAPVVTFLAVVVAGVAGFVVLADVSVVEAAFWLLDPTSLELHFREPANSGGRTAKAFALVVFSALVVAGVWIGETVLTAAVGGRMQEQLRRVQTRRTIDDCTDHVIVCGYGLFGRTVAGRLDGRDVVAVEQDDERFRDVDDDVLALNGDAQRERVLRDANIEAADTLVAAIDDTSTNIQIAITASGIAPDVYTVVRVGDEDFTTLARRAGADEVVIPEVLSGERVGEMADGETLGDVNRNGR